MYNQPVISILVPVRNGAAHLRECIDSILAQSYHAWECIIVNDHSTDATWEIINRYASKEPRIKCYDCTQGKGITPALRTAYTMSQGDYVTRMDADDIMLPQKLEVLIDGLQEYGGGYLATGGVEYFSADGIGEGYMGYADWLNGLTSSGSNWLDRYKECVIPSPCWMLSRGDFERIGAFGSDRYPEDYDLAFRMYAGGLQVIACEQILHRWRDYPERTSRNDTNYADNRFLELKMEWYCRLERDSDPPLTVWGAGKKGKRIAKYLIEHTIPFDWVTDNEKKIGHNIYGVILGKPEPLRLRESKVIIAIANVTEQVQVINLLDDLGRVRGESYFLFC